MTKNNQIPRRRFLQNSGQVTAAAFSAPMIINSKTVQGANDKINLGFIGVGRRAGGLINDFGRTSGAEIVAISDVNASLMKQRAQGKSWKIYQDYREMLESSEIDAVVIATPDHWHAHNAIDACIAGKDVYVEKPMTLTIEEGQLMVKAARKHKRIVQCGSQQRSSKECRVGCELVRNGAVGKIHTVHAANYPSPWDRPFPTQKVPEGLDWDMWLGQCEERGFHQDIFTPRAKPGWISLVPYSGGEVTGWGAHGLDIIQWGLGTELTGPTEIWPEGNDRVLDREVHFKFENGVEVIMDNKGPQGGGVFVGDKGQIRVDRGYYNVEPGNLEEAASITTKLPVSHNHQQNFLDCIRSRELPIADVEIAHRSTTLCHMANIARWTHRKLQWDPEKEVFIGDDDANTYISRPRRSGYELPVV